MSSSLKRDEPYRTEQMAGSSRGGNRTYSLPLRSIRLDRPIRRSENIPYGNKHGRNDGTKDKAVDPKHSDAAESGDQHEVIRQFGVFSDEDGSHETVDEADDEGAVEQQNDCPPDFP